MLPGEGMRCFPIFEDNHGALELAQNPVTNSNSKHIDVRQTFPRELVCWGGIKSRTFPLNTNARMFLLINRDLTYDLIVLYAKFLINSRDGS